MSPLDIQNFLSSIQPFKGLAKKDLKKITDKTIEKNFAKGETVFNEGELADSVWVLFKGRIQILKYSTGDKPVALESLTKGELFGTLCRMGGNGRNYPCTAIASDTVTTLQILDSTFLDYFNKNPIVTRGVCTLCADRLKDIQDLRCLGQQSVSIRVASVITRLHNVYGDTIPLTKREISELVGSTVETTFRVMSSFQKKGYITSQYGKIKVKDIESLKEMVAC